MACVRRKRLGCPGYSGRGCFAGLLPGVPDFPQARQRRHLQSPRVLARSGFAGWATRCPPSFDLVSNLDMRLIPFLCALPLIASFARGQASSPKLPCDFSGELLRNQQGQVAILTSDEMKKRATHKVDLDAPLLKQLDFRSTVIVEVLVGTSGEVVCAKSLAGMPMTRWPVEKALRSWTFKPRNQEGKPVAYLGQVDFMLCNTRCGEEPFCVTLLK